MGWKNVKNHYRIEHFVHMRDGNLCIGSAYISDIIVVRPDGTLLKADRTPHAEIKRYQDEIQSDASTFQRLLQEPDQFATCLTVYSFANGQILAHQCEAPGWPNVTHDGQLMYDNTHFLDREECIAKAISEYEAGARLAQSAIERAEVGLRSLRSDLARFEEYVATLKTHPAARH